MDVPNWYFIDDGRLGRTDSAASLVRVEPCSYAHTRGLFNSTSDETQTVSEAALGG